jgi:hypothetical protein
MLDRVTRSGDALVIGRTRDGGAISITVISGDDREKLYASTDDELAAVITELCEAYLDVTEG